MRTFLRTRLRRSARARSRFGYDHFWWGEAGRDDVDDRSYWAQTRRPLHCLIFVLPILISYEVGVIWLGGGASEALRTGADAWLRHGLAALGLVDRWLLPMMLVLALLAWQAVDRLDWRFSVTCLVGMAIESLVLAVALIGLSHLVDLGFARLEGQAVLAASSDQRAQAVASLVGYLGAGVYEEALFRLALIPLFLACLKVLQTPTILAQTVALTASALLFSIAHHAGTPGEAFTWFAFIFRWLAGVFFAWVFVVRGFGVAVGAHTAYDILVGWLGWHF